MEMLPIVNLTSRVLFYASIVLFLFSLNQQCYCTTNGCGAVWTGWAILRFGILGVFLCPAGVTWLANPAILIAWLFSGRKLKIAFISGCSAFGLAISFLFFSEIQDNLQGDTYVKITDHKIGYFLWLSGTFLMAISSSIRYLYHNKMNKAGSLMGHTI